MTKPTAVVDLELTQLLTSPANLESTGDTGDAAVLCRVHGRPLGIVHATVADSQIALDEAIPRVLDTMTPGVATLLAERAIACGRPPRWVDAGALLSGGSDLPRSGPLVTVAVLSRSGTEPLRQALDALSDMDYDPLDVLVVDGSPRAGIERFVRAHYPTVRYVRERRPEVEHARNRAIAECRGDILAFTSDEVIADRRWISSFVRVLLADPEVMAVAGPVMPSE